MPKPNTETINHGPCPACDSSDAYSVDPKTGWGKCFSCGHRVPPKETGIKRKEKPPTPETEDDTQTFAPLTDVFRSYDKRGLTLETIKRYKVDVGGPNASYEARYPRFDAEGNHVGNKVRYPKKEGGDKFFSYEGTKSRMTLFGMNCFEPGSAKAVTVVEGQDDAMAVFQMMGSRYPVVSVDSAQEAARQVRDNFEWLNSFETIVFAFDNDEPGRKAAKQAADVGFALGKVKVLTLRKHKDGNEYLLNKDGEAFTREWWQAPTHKPDGLKLGSDMWSEIIDRKESFTVQYPFDGLNRLTYGLRLSELVVVTADSGVGKTSVLKHIEHTLLTDPEVVEKGYGVGFLHLEEPNGDTALGLLSIHNSIPYHIPGIERPESDLRRAYDELLNNDRVVIWDHFGSNSVDRVLDKVRHMHALGCKYIVLDHLSIIVSDQAGDERKQLDEIATKLKTLTMELDIAVIAVIHTNRQGQIRGTAGVEQLANIVLRLERNKTDGNEWRRNITRVTVEKNRFTGYTGPASYLWYNKETGRLTELDDEGVVVYEQGGHMSDSDIPF